MGFAREGINGFHSTSNFRRITTSSTSAQAARSDICHSGGVLDSHCWVDGVHDVRERSQAVGERTKRVQIRQCWHHSTTRFGGFLSKKRARGVQPLGVGLDTPDAQERRHIMLPSRARYFWDRSRGLSVLHGKIKKMGTLYYTNYWRRRKSGYNIDIVSTVNFRIVRRNTTIIYGNHTPAWV